jgi:hypothetical protein
VTDGGYSKKLPSKEEMLRRMDSDLWEIARYALVIFLGAVAIGLICRFGILIAHGATPDEWFRLVVELEKREAELDADERRFVRNVINRLTVSPDALPTPEHRVWLLNIKRRLEHAK